MHLHQIYCHVIASLLILQILCVNCRTIEVDDLSFCPKTYYYIPSVNDTASITWTGTPVRLKRRYSKSSCETEFSVPYQHQACVRVKSFDLKSCSAEVNLGYKTGSGRTRTTDYMLRGDCITPWQPVVGNETTWCSGRSSMVFQLVTGNNKVPDSFEIELVAVPDAVLVEIGAGDYEESYAYSIQGSLTAVVIVILIIAGAVGYVIFRRCQRSRQYGRATDTSGPVTYHPATTVVMSNTQPTTVQSQGYSYQAVPTQPGYVHTAPPAGYGQPPPGYVGSPQAQVGVQPAQPGFQPVQPGFQPAQPGYQPVQPGYQPVQPGYQPGFQPVSQGHVYEPPQYSTVLDEKPKI